MTLKRFIAFFVAGFLATIAFAMVSSNGIVVDPGETETNGDIQIQNNHNKRDRESLSKEDLAGEPEGPSAGKARITPGNGSEPGNSQARLDKNFKGEVSDLEKGDTVTAGSDVDATISGTGGSVTLQGGSDVTVNNTDTNPALPNDSITVNYPGGSMSVAPGGTATIHTN